MPELALLPPPGNTTALKLETKIVQRIQVNLLLKVDVVAAPIVKRQGN